MTVVQIPLELVIGAGACASTDKDRPLLGGVRVAWAGDLDNEGIPEHIVAWATDQYKLVVLGYRCGWPEAKAVIDDEAGVLVPPSLWRKPSPLLDRRRSGVGALEVDRTALTLRSASAVWSEKSMPISEYPKVAKLFSGEMTHEKFSVRPFHFADLEKVSDAVLNPLGTRPSARGWRPWTVTCASGLKPLHLICSLDGTSTTAWALLMPVRK